jgi:hypothetical protein
MGRQRTSFCSAIRSIAAYTGGHDARSGDRGLTVSVKALPLHILSMQIFDDLKQIGVSNV